MAVRMAVKSDTLIGMSAVVNALLVTDDDDEAKRFCEAVADFAMSWSNDVACTATLRLPPLGEESGA